MKLLALARIPIAALMVAGCTSLVPGASPVAVPSAAPSDSAQTAAPTAAATGTPTAEVTFSPTVAPPTSDPTPVRPRPSLAEPPAAALGTSDFAVTGKLGTYCWSTGCVDTAGFYKATTPHLTVAEGDLLIFSMEDGEFANWSASYGVNGSAPTNLGGGGEPVDPDSSEPPSQLLSFVEFESPPAGDWVVEVSVHFEDNWDAFYGWHVTVE